MRETLVSYAFLLPAMLFFVLFVLVPMGMGVVTSFFRYNMKGMTFTGLSNYMTMFADPVWQKSLVNTLLLVVGSVPITVLCAFCSSHDLREESIYKILLPMCVLPACGYGYCSGNSCLEMDLRPFKRYFKLDLKITGSD